MRIKRKSLFMTAVLVFIMVVSIGHYSMYIGQQFYNESTQNLLSTYEQVDKTFLMFAQRNWNVLADWSLYLRELSEQNDPERKWRDFVKERENWQYSDFYVFNEECQYWTVDGRQGTAEHVKKAFEELYEDAAPIVSSYTSSSGIRKVLFAVPTDPITLDGVTYTALAVTYDNTVMQNMIGGQAYGGESDCYIIYSNGDVLLSVEPKTEITQTIGNLFTVIEERADSYDKKKLEQMRLNVKNQKEGSVSYRYEGTDYYLVYLPVGIKDWSIVGIVEQDAVDVGMKKVQNLTIGMLSVITACIAVGVTILIARDARKRVEREMLEKEELAKRKKLADQLFDGMAKIVDRFAVCDLKNNRYEYHERRSKLLYPQEGEYEDLIKQISDRYAVLTDGENAKITNMLSVENVRALISTKKDNFKFEYCARDKSVFQIMTVIPVEWEGNELSKIMLVSQDMGQQHELENLANTDGLTGLFNKRYFETMLKILDEKKTHYALFYMDLDRFKPVNDTYGHEMGDKILKEVAHRLLGCIRSHDYAFRMGGDEFTLIINGNMDKSLCEKRIERIKNTIGAPYFIDGEKISIGISCGSAVYPDEANTSQEILSLADKRMYQDKEINHAQR